MTLLSNRKQNIVMGLSVAVALVAYPLIAATGIVRIAPLGKEKINGLLTITATANGLVLSGNIFGFTPSSNHGFHIHECGDCGTVDGTSAGGHFNPTRHKHGAPKTNDSHLGDLGNIHADENGAASINIVLPETMLFGGDGIVGRSVIVHAKEDDFTTQPNGASGGRIGCGVIGLKN